MRDGGKILYKIDTSGLTSRALAQMIEGKTPKEIREVFYLHDDLTKVSDALQCCVCLTWPL